MNTTLWIARTQEAEPEETIGESANVKKDVGMNRSERYDLPFFGHEPRDMGMPPSAIASRIDEFEQAYAKWLGRSRWRRFVVTHIARTPCFLFRKQVYDLMQFVSTMMRNAFAETQQQDDRAAAAVTMGHVRELRLFLAEHFPGDLQEADSANRPLIKQAELVMARLKRGEFV
jgi:hypothetical protein